MSSVSGTADTKKQGIWLVGGTLAEINGSKLLSNHQVLGRYFHLHLTENETIHDSATATAREVLAFWDKARIPTKYKCDVISKIRKLHSNWQLLKKNASRKTESQQQKEKTFVDFLDDLFDVAHADALTVIPIPEDLDFLLAQREKGRRGTMGPVDITLFRKEQKRLQKEKHLEDRKQQEVDRVKKESVTVQLETSDESGSDEVMDEVTFAIPQPRKRKRPSSVLTLDVASALDRSKLSDKKATYVLAAAAQSLGRNVEEIAINKKSIRRGRRKYREYIAKEIRDSFAPEVVLTVHWDGKILPALTGKESVDGLTVLVSGQGLMKLLGIPKIENGTGQAQAEAVFVLLEEWNLTDRVQLMSFDTTASNTGRKGAVCVLLEQKLNKDLLALACRHHILELIVAKVFNQLMESSSGPNIKLFQRFSDSWNSFNKETFESGMKDESIALEIGTLKEELQQFLLFQLTVHHPRDDYKELLQLALLFLGIELADFTFRAPGAFHRARWMAKLIYCLKIFLFRAQFRLKARELCGLRAFNIFVVQIYLKAWYLCACPSSAPMNDLELLKDLVQYKANNKLVAAAAIKSFSGHLWFLSETLIGLAFFDPKVSRDTKLAMVKALEQTSLEDPPLRCIKLAENLVLTKNLSDFVSKNSRRIFLALGILEEFLKEDPSTWETNDDFNEAKLKVVNDAAERGVTLIQAFNGVLSNQEEQKQYLLQVVENHRKTFPNPNKSTLVKGLLKK